MKFPKSQVVTCDITYAELLNPCLKEQELTYKCFNDNDFNKELCQLQIENYKTCKAFWNFVRSDRRRKGMYPVLPPVEEREGIKKEYMNKFQRM